MSQHLYKFTIVHRHNYSVISGANIKRGYCKLNIFTTQDDVKFIKFIKKNMPLCLTFKGLFKTSSEISV